ncbi:hypothetical protein ACQPUL_09980 [Clostridium butyricum]|uniref:hypothetical protein n=1 Tax=Clostridium butyricum TaxID=1492 RepID=UPI003D356A38
MENVIIKNPVIIKESKINKETLEMFKAGLNQLNESEILLDYEFEKEAQKVEELKIALSGLSSEKADLEMLITKGNAGLTAKLLDTNKKIKQAETDILEAEKNLEGIEEIKNSQAKFLEESLYNQFIENRDLASEFSENAERLQLEYYSLLYMAFEVENKLIQLGEEYYQTANNKFPNYKPYRDFTTMFPSRQYINKAKNNFPNIGSHKGVYSTQDVLDYVDKFENIKDNKDFTFYK